MCDLTESAHFRILRRCLRMTLFPKCDSLVCMLVTASFLDCDDLSNSYLRAHLSACAGLGSLSFYSAKSLDIFTRL